MPRGHACISVDLDTTDCYREIHGLPPRRRASGGGVADSSYLVGVTRLLELFGEHGIAATLFVVGQDVEAEAHRELLQAAVAQGHELASHSHTHLYNLRSQPLARQREEFVCAEEALARVSKVPVQGFRAPGYNIAPSLLALCQERGYRYDSSIFACPPYYGAKAAIMAFRALSGRPSRSAMTLPETLLAPITPYRADPATMRPLRRAVGAAGGAGIWEIPMAVVPGLRFPLIGTSLHLLGGRGFEALYPLVRRTHGQLLNLEFHALDFMDATDPGVEDLVGVQPDLGIAWPVKRALYARVFRQLAQHYAFVTLAAATLALERAPAPCFT